MKKSQGLWTTLTAGVLVVAGLLLSAPSHAADNTIVPATLTEEQYSALGAGADTELMVYEYHANGRIGELEIWIDVYENGQLAEPRMVSLKKNCNGKLTGKFAILVSRSSVVTYQIIDLDGGEQATGSTRRHLDGEVLQSGIRRAFMVDNRDIPVAGMIFGAGGGNGWMDMGKAMNSPYAHIVSLCFS